MAVLPTPGSPIRTGLFLVRRDRTWMTRRISSSRPMTGSSLPARASVGQVAAVLLERRVGALGVLGRDALAAADALERLQEGLATGRVPLEEGLALAADLGDRRAAGARSRRTRRRGAWPRPRRVRRRGGRAGSSDSEPPWMRARRGEDGRELAAEPGQVHAEPAQGLGRDAVVGLDERGQDVLGVEDRAVEALGGGLGGEDGLLGLLGESVELHVGSLVGASRSAWVGLLDDVEEGPGGGRGLVGQAGRQDDLGPDDRSPWPSALNRGMPWPRSRNVRPGLGPRRDRQEDASLERRRPGPRAPSRASSSVIGSSRSRSAPLRVKVASGVSGRRCTMSPPPGPLPVSRIRVPVSAPGGIVTSSRLPSTSTSRVVPW